MIINEELYDKGIRRAKTRSVRGTESSGGGKYAGMGVSDHHYQNRM
ncbi:MAG: hypothetical protein R3C26_05605 [Calditrichia bacterium]